MRTVVAFLAHERSARFQQWCDVGTVRRMAIAAIFCSRLMFPQERTALFSMTLEAGFIDRVFLQQLRTGRTVQIVAIRTDHFAFTDRMVRHFVAVSALLFVAGVTNFCLSRFLAYLVMGVMNLVT